MDSQKLVETVPSLDTFVVGTIGRDVLPDIQYSYRPSTTSSEAQREARAKRGARIFLDVIERRLVGEMVATAKRKSLSELFLAPHEIKKGVGKTGLLFVYPTLLFLDCRGSTEKCYVRHGMYKASLRLKGKDVWEAELKALPILHSSHTSDERKIGDDIARKLVKLLLRDGLIAK